MTQSVELLLDADSDDAVRAEWELLRAAGLPSAWRPEPSGSHCPHITLLAAAEIDPGLEPALRTLVADLDLGVRLGSPLVFTARKSFILVRQVIASVELMTLQAAVGELCGPGLNEAFDPGRWVPHITLGHRFGSDQLGSAIALLARQERTAEVELRITRCRRWDGEAKQDWLVSSAPTGT